MTHSRLTVILAMLGLCASCATVPNGSDYEPPRTSGGTPNIEGVWDYSTLTPFERPAEFAGKEVLTLEEAKASSIWSRSLGRGPLRAAS